MMQSMRRKDREKPADFALAVTDTCAWAVMATVNPDGSPYCVPLSMAREGEWLYFHGAPVGQKTDNLKHKNRVCVSCVGATKPDPEVYSMEYESAVIKGTAYEVTDRAEKIHGLELICLRYASENMADFNAAIERSLDCTAVWKIHIDEISGKGRKK